jgi:hypothetical protein
MLKKAIYGTLNIVSLVLFTSSMLFLASAWSANGLLLLSLTLFAVPLVYTRRNIARARGCAKVFKEQKVVSAERERVTEKV